MIPDICLHETESTDISFFSVVFLPTVSALCVESASFAFVLSVENIDVGVEESFHVLYQAIFDLVVVAVVVYLSVLYFEVGCFAHGLVHLLVTYLSPVFYISKGHRHVVTARPQHQAHLA